MQTDDTFKTISKPSEGTYTEKRSKFLAFALPVRTVDEVKDIVRDYQKKYYDARHVCYAYMLGPERTDFRANDNGEPSGTAGKPILGQINSYGLTDILIIDERRDAHREGGRTPDHRSRLRHRLHHDPPPTPLPHATSQSQTREGRNPADEVSVIIISKAACAPRRAHISCLLNR